MTWAAVGMTALGAVQGDKNERKAIQDMEYKAELMKYAPYSKMASEIASRETQAGPDQMTSMLGGGMNGMSINRAMKDDAMKQALVDKMTGPGAGPGTPGSNLMGPPAPVAGTQMPETPESLMAQAQPMNPQTPEEMRKYQLYQQLMSGRQNA